MLWALLAAYLLGGGGIDNGGILSVDGIAKTITQVELVVDDPVREKEAVNILKKLQEEITFFNQSVSQSGKDLGMVYNDHSANSNSMITAIDTLNEASQATQQRAIELRFELKKYITAEEWMDIFGKDSTSN